MFLIAYFMNKDEKVNLELEKFIQSKDNSFFGGKIKLENIKFVKEEIEKQSQQLLQKK